MKSYKTSRYNRRVGCALDDGRVATKSLEFFLADTCNLRCAHCAASAPYLRAPNFPALSSFEDSLSHLGRVLRARQIKFLGGEPLLNPQCPAFLAAARRSGMFQTIHVTTNGLLAGRLGDDFWSSLDVLEVSLYRGAPGELDKAGIEALRRTAERFGVRLELEEKRSFFRAILDQPNPNRGAVERIYRECGEAHTGPCHTLYNGRLYRCSRVHTIDRYLSVLGVAHASMTETDGLAVDASLTVESLRTYLETPRPLAACEFCLGTSGRQEDHRQLSRSEIDARRSGAAPVVFSRKQLAGRWPWWRWSAS